MKKIKKVLVILTAILSVFILSSCGEDKTPKLEFLKTDIALTLGQEADLNDQTLLKIENVEFEDIHFVSKNQKVVFISTDKKIRTVGAGTTTVEAFVKDVKSTIIVNVTKAKQPFAKVTEIDYNPNLAQISWNPPFIIADGQEIIATNYEIEVFRNNVPFTNYEKVSNTKYNILQGGNYTFSVKAIATGYAYSEKVSKSFTVLDTPNNLRFEKGVLNTHVIRWDKVDNAVLYALKINDEEYKVTGNSFTIDFEKAGSYFISVKAIKTETEHSVFTKSLEVVKLEKPVLKLEDGILKVTLSKQERIDHFALKVKAYQNPENIDQFSSVTGEFDLSDLQAGNYIAEVKSVAINSNLIISSEISLPLNFEKLALPTITFDKTTKQVNVSGVENTAKLFVHDLLTQTTEIFDFVENKYDFDKPYGEFKLWAQNFADQENVINSNISSEIYVKVLGYTKDVQHAILEENQEEKSIISFQKVLGATDYQILIDQTLVQAQIYDEVDNRISFVLNESPEIVFALPKQYEIEVVAIDLMYEHILVYGNEENNKTIVERLDAIEEVSITFPVQNQPISWQALTGATSYAFVLYKNASFMNEGILSQPSFDVENLSFGFYRLEIYTLGNQKEFLSSLTFYEIEFSKQEKLATPNLSLDRENLLLVVSPVENANAYRIFYQENLITTLTNELTFSLSSYLLEEKQHDFVVVAINNQDNFENGGNLIPSDNALFAVEKLKKIEKLIFEDEQVFKYDDDLLLTIPNSSNYVLEVKINNQIVDISSYDTGQLNQFSLSVKKQANQNKNNPYLISSEEFIANFERLEQVKNLNFTNWVLAWESVLSADSYEIVISKDNFSKTLTATENQLDLNQVDFKAQLENGFSFTVQAVANQNYIENNQLQKLSSVVSEVCQVKVLSTPEIEEVIKIEQNKYKVIWQQIENAQFEIDFDENIEIINLNEILLELEHNRAEYILKIKAISPNYISSNQTVFKFERMKQVEEIDVFENLTFKINYNLMPEAVILVNNEAVLIENNINIIDEAVLNNNIYNYEIEVLAEFIDANVYYISSEKSLFGFEKHTKISNLIVEDDFIKWQENPYATNYELIFENSLNQTLSVVISAKNTENDYVNSFSLADERLVEFVNDSLLEYTVKIKVKINDYQLEKENIGKIDSDLSDSANILKLEKVQNVKVSVFDISDQKQSVLTISWDAVIGASYYNVYANNELLLENQTLTSVQSVDLTFENSLKENGVLTGKFAVEVVAFGENKVVSEKSEAVEFRRLNKVKGYKTTDNKGGVQWDANIYSENFVLYIENQNQEVSEFVNLESVVSYSFVDLLKLEAFEKGTLKLYILVSGDGASTFSSEFESLEVIRLDAPQFEVLGNKIVVQESLIFEDASFELVVYFKENGQEELVEVQKASFEAGEFLLPTEWRFKDGNPILTQGVFVFEMTAVSPGYFTSIKTIKQETKLENIVIEGFKKVDSPIIMNETAYEFLINIGNISQTDQTENPELEIVITVTNNIDNQSFVFIDKSAQNRQGQVVYDLEELFLAMRGNFTVEVKATAMGYIDSKISTISGIRLAENTSLRARTGVLTWSRSLSASANGYMLKVNYGSKEEGQSEGTFIKHINNIDAVSDKLEGISGAITANIKILSNMPFNETISNNIILDSFYMGQVLTLEDGSLLYEEAPYNAVKLSAVEEVSVKQGMVYFKKATEQEAIEYVLIALDEEFEGQEYSLFIELQDEDYIQALSVMFYQGQYKLSKNKVYSFSIKALAVNANGLDSDVGDTVRFKVLDSVSDLSVAWKEYDTGETNRFDTVMISWLPSMAILNPQYIYSINASSVTAGEFNVVDNNEYIIRSNNALNPKNHNFRIRVMGTSEENIDGYYWLTSDYSSSITLTGLARPEVSLREGVLTWKSVPYAEGYYIYYMKRTSAVIVTPSLFAQNKIWHSELITGTSWKIPESFSDSLINQAYYIAVVAINRDISRKYMPSPYGTTFVITADENGEEIPDAFGYLVVPKSPDLFGNNEGVLMWYGLDYNIEKVLEIPVGLNAGNSPFVYPADIDYLFEIKINVKIEDSTGRVLIKDFYAVSLFYADIFDSPFFLNYAGIFGFDVNQKYGLGHTDEFINETYPSIKAGSNFISAMQIGNDFNLVSSKYNDGKEFYIPQQVNATISNYILSWSEIDLPAGKPYNNTTGKYIVVSEDDEGKRIVVTKTDDLSINLIDFVNDDTLKPGNHKLYVIVAGDGDYYLNGIAGPYISTFVLPAVSANLNRGVLCWDSMQNTSGYLVKALTDGQDYNFVQSMLVNSWDFNQLRATDALGNHIEYNLTLQATGNGKTIISGKETNFGKVIKLQTPQVSIDEGIFKWNDILLNLGYMINIAGDDNITFTIGTSITEYESIYKGFNAYNFRAVGSTTSVLGAGTLNYAISSYMDVPLNAVMLQNVKEVSTHKGQIVWKAMTDYDNNPINEYKLSFDQINYKQPVFLTNNDYNMEIIGGSTYLLYELLEGYGAGYYKIYLQAYSSGTYTKNEVEYTYLLGEIDTVTSYTTFEKLQTVENIRSLDGVLYWDNPNASSTSYRVDFVQGLQRYSFSTSLNQFDPTLLNETEQALYNQIVAETSFDVIIQVLGNNEDLINSDEVRISNFIKLKTIDASGIDYIIEEEEETGFTIRWYVSSETELTNYEYVISYIDNPDNPVTKMIYSAENENIIKGYDSDKKLYYGQIDASYLLDRESKSLTYSVAVIPITNANILTSSFSVERSVFPPESLSGEFLFDTSTQKISWAYEKEGSDVKFRIVDELVSLDQNNQITVIKTNVYLSQEKHFYPKEIGLHRIKIAVVLVTANPSSNNVSSSYVYFYHETEPGLINHSSFEIVSQIQVQQFTLFDFNLFESGEGSLANPYKILTATQFNNIAYRTEKPTYLEGENRFTFVQENNLTVALTQGIQNFAGNYNGQNYEIDYHLTSSKNTAIQEISLFESVLSVGQIKNLVIKSKITLNNSISVSTVKLSALTITNNGLIENVLIKTFELVSNISNSQIKYIYGAVSVQNNGMINTVISKADITFIGGQGHQSMLSSDISVSGLVDNNDGQIVNSGSYANFKITARIVAVAGVARVSQSNASITRAFNSGNFDIEINAGNSTATYIAGLVGRNLGIISSSYSSASSIKLDLMGTSNTIYVGGLIGLATGANGALINNSFTSTTEIQILNKGVSSSDVGIMMGRTTATSNPAQIKSYYKNIASLSIFNGNLENFDVEAISTMNWLLNQLNAKDSNAFRLIGENISHTWQQDFELD